MIAPIPDAVLTAIHQDNERRQSVHQTETPLIPWPHADSVAMIKAQIAANRRRRSHQPTDVAAQIAVASNGHLSPSEVRTIRRRMARASEPVDVIADDYDLATVQVRAIAQGVWVSAQPAEAA